MNDLEYLALLYTIFYRKTIAPQRREAAIGSMAVASGGEPAGAARYRKG